MFDWNNLKFKSIVLLLYAACLILSLVGCVIAGGLLFIIPSLLVTAAGYYIMYRIVYGDDKKDK